MSVLSMTEIVGLADPITITDNETASDTEVQAFATLYEETFDAVYRYACALTGDPAFAEDVTAEVYLRAWRKRDTFRGDGKRLSWLLSITHNFASTALRKAAREITGTVDSESRTDPAPSPELAAVATGDRAVLLTMIRELTLEQQQVIVLRFFQEWSHAEIAERLGRKETAIRALQYRALKRMRGLIQPLELTPARDGTPAASMENSNGA